MSNYPPGVTNNDPHFTLESEEDYEEPNQCVVLECDQPQAPLDTYCTRHAVIANQMEQLYRGALKAGYFNKETT